MKNLIKIRPEEGFEEIYPGLTGLMSRMADDNCVGLLIVHDQSNRTWNYMTNLHDPAEILAVLQEMTMMLESDTSGSYVN